jgi:xylulokinase
MSLLGIDIGTTACKVAAFSEGGRLIGSNQAEYDVQRRGPGWAELDSIAVWGKVKRAIAQVTSKCTADPVQALAVSSLGEAMVPVTQDREILAPSILNFDVRGEEYLVPLSQVLTDERLYRINGNTLGNHYGLTKLKWIKENLAELYERTDKFLLWGSFVPFMLGADPAVDFSLANRTLLFDLEQEMWSRELLEVGEIEEGKLPSTVPSGRTIGSVSRLIAAEVGLAPGVSIVSGAHDQCANAVGCGAIGEGHAFFGMGTFLCITPVFGSPRDPEAMIALGLNTEHHAVPAKFVTFIYNQGGSCVKWFRDTFAAAERREAETAGQDIYTLLFSETTEEPSGVMVLPEFASSGVISGLHWETTRGDILKGIIEGTTFDLKRTVDSLSPTGIQISDCRAVGGGSKSDRWIQTCADIMGRPFVRPHITEAGALGAAIIAGVGCGLFASFEAGVEAMVSLDRRFEPDMRKNGLYEERFKEYGEIKKRLAPST